MQMVTRRSKLSIGIRPTSNGIEVSDVDEEAGESRQSYLTAVMVLGSTTAGRGNDSASRMGLSSTQIMRLVLSPMVFLQNHMQTVVMLLSHVVVAHRQMTVVCPQRTLPRRHLRPVVATVPN